MSSIKSSMAYMIFFAVSFFVSVSAFGQQYPIYTQYMFNGLALNPAYSGTQGTLVMTASTRKQWTGIKGAPQTHVFSAHSPIKFSRSSAGMILTLDKVGVTKQTMAYATYAYHIPVSENGKVSVGAQVGATYYQSKFNDLNIVTQGNVQDAAFAGSDSRMLPNLGIGAFYYTRKTYIGISLPTLINNKWNNRNDLVRSTQERHYFATAGHVIDINPDLKLKPNILLRWVEGGPFQYDLNANCLIKDVVWAGISYRMQDSIDALFEWYVNDQLSIGYSYGYPTSKIASIQSGTHEVIINFRVDRGKHTFKSPRYLF